MLSLRAYKVFWTCCLVLCLTLLLTIPAFSQTDSLSARTPPPGKFLYVAGGYELGILAPTGQLKFVRHLGTNGATFVDATNQFAYVQDYIAGPVLDVSTINQANGSLTPVAGSPFREDPADVYASAFPDAKGQFIFTIGTDVNSNMFLSVFRFNRTTGAISETDRVQIPNAVAVGTSVGVCDLSEKYVYAGLSNELAGYAFNATAGTVTPVPNAPMASPSVLMLQDAGKFLYSMKNDNTISGYQINEQTGELTEVPGSPFQNPLQVAMALDLVNRFLYTTNTDFYGGNTTDVVTTFRIDPTSGGLTQIATSGQSVLNAPANIVADPSGKYVYVGDLNIPVCIFDECQGATNSFKVDPSTGSLTVVTNQLLYPGDPQDDFFAMTVAH